MFIPDISTISLHHNFYVSTSDHVILFYDFVIYVELIVCTDLPLNSNPTFLVLLLIVSSNKCILPGLNGRGSMGSPSPLLPHSTRRYTLVMNHMLVCGFSFSYLSFFFLFMYLHYQTVSFSVNYCLCIDKYVYSN